MDGLSLARLVVATVWTWDSRATKLVSNDPEFYFFAFYPFSIFLA